LLPSDFESDASANSTIPAMVTGYIIAHCFGKINNIFQKVWKFLISNIVIIKNILYNIIYYINLEEL